MDSKTYDGGETASVHWSSEEDKVEPQDQMPNTAENDPEFNNNSGENQIPSEAAPSSSGVSSNTSVPETNKPTERTGNESSTEQRANDKKRKNRIMQKIKNLLRIKKGQKKLAEESSGAAAPVDA